MGQGKDRAIAVNGAFPPLLMHYSGLAKYILSENERDITLPKVSKESMAYAYSFMLAREQDATILKPKFENLTLQQLAHLHDACNKLQYESLSDKAFNRIKWVIGKKGCSEYDSFKAVYEFVPSLREAIIKAAAKEKLYGGKPEFVGQICEIPGISNSIDAIVKEYEAQVKAEAEALRLAQQASKPAANEISKCKDIRCYTCKQKGHVAKNCRGGKPPKCYKCGFFGHIARNCNSA